MPLPAIPVLLSILGAIAKESLSFAKFLLGLAKVALLRVALSLKFAIVYITHYCSSKLAFLAAIFLAFEVAVASLSFFVITPISSSLISTLLPDGNEWAQAIYYLAWESGLSFSLLWSLLLVYWANVFAAHRVLDILAQALSYRVMIWDGERQISMGLLSGRGG